MTNPAPADEMPDYSHDLVFDKGESGAAQYSYYSLVTDYGSPADILIRVNDRPRNRDNWPDAETLAREVVKRWNAYNTRTRPDRMGVEATELRRAIQMFPCGVDPKAVLDWHREHGRFVEGVLHGVEQHLLAQTPDGGEKK